jgi:hypothetical protein
MQTIPEIIHENFMSAAIWQVYGPGAMRAATLAAEERREAWPPELGRYVFIHGGEVLDDGDELGPAEDLVPGVYAVDRDGTVLVTAGGDAVCGAKDWFTVNASQCQPVRRPKGFGVWGWILMLLLAVATMVLLWVAGLVAQGAMLGEAQNSTLTDERE